MSLFQPFGFMKKQKRVNCLELLTSQHDINKSNNINGETFITSLTGLTVSTGTKLAHNGEFFLATNTNKVYKSYDAITWNSGTTITGGNIRDISWNGTYFLVVKETSGFNYTINYSTDGISWSGSTTAGGLYTYNSIASNTTYDVAVSNQNTGNQVCIWRSSNKGVNWSNNSTGLLSQGVTAIEANGKFYISGTLSSVPKSYYSTDGISWTDLGTSISNSQLKGVAYNGNIYVAGGFPSGTTDNHMATSTDGINWTQYSTTFRSAGKIIWNGDYFFMLNEAGSNGEGELFRSSDGINWTSYSPFSFVGNASDIISTVSPFTSPPFPNNNFCNL